jgi:hypothetical protein
VALEALPEIDENETRRVIHVSSHKKNVVRDAENAGRAAVSEDPETVENRRIQIVALLGPSEHPAFASEEDRRVNGEDIERLRWKRPCNANGAKRSTDQLKKLERTVKAANVKFARKTNVRLDLIDLVLGRVKKPDVLRILFRRLWVEERVTVKNEEKGILLHSIGKASAQELIVSIGTGGNRYHRFQVREVEEEL